MVPSALLDASLSSYTYFSVYMFTLLLNVLEKTVLKKNRNCNVNQLNHNEKR